MSLPNAITRTGSNSENHVITNITYKAQRLWASARKGMATTWKPRLFPVCTPKPLAPTTDVAYRFEPFIGLRRTQPLKFLMKRILQMSQMIYTLHGLLPLVFIPYELAAAHIW